MSESGGAYTSGAIILVSQDKTEVVEDAHPDAAAEAVTVYTVTQVERTNALPRAVPGPQHRYEIHWDFGPVRVTGYVDSNTLEIGVTISVAGIHIGTFYGNLKTGIKININLFVAEGSISFFLKNGKEVWVKLQLKIRFDGTFDKEVKLLTI